MAPHRYSAASFNEDGTEVDGQILIFSKHYSNISFIVNRETAPTDIEPIWLNLGGKIREYKVFAIQAVEIDNWEDFISAMRRDTFRTRHMN